MPFLGLVQAGPWFRSSMWISSVVGISKVLCTSEVASATRTSENTRFPPLRVRCSKLGCSDMEVQVTTGNEFDCLILSVMLIML